MTKGGKKKLSIKKRTLRKLDEAETGKVQGGVLIGQTGGCITNTCPNYNVPPVFGGNNLSGADPYGQTIGKVVPVLPSKQIPGSL